MNQTRRLHAGNLDRLDLYRKLQQVRRLDLHISEIYMSDILKTPVHLSLGQEAVAVGVCSLLRREDPVFLNYRNHAHYLAKGGNLQALVNELNNRATGCSGGRGGSMHVCDPEAGILGTTAIVGGAVPLAVGSALASKLAGDGLVTATFFGDGAAEEGSTYESLNLAVVHDLPLLFVCENNGYAIYASMEERASNASIVDRFSGLGIASFSGDGNDLDDVLHVTEQALDLVRRGQPALIELHTMLMSEHVGTHVRAKQNLLRESWDEWVGNCPVSRFRTRLLGEGVPADRLDEIDRGVVREIAAAFAAALDEPFPAPEDLLRHVYR